MHLTVSKSDELLPIFFFSNHSLERKKLYGAAQSVVVLKGLYRLAFPVGFRIPKVECLDPLPKLYGAMRA
ncbi:hypothetical protein AAJ72_07665 [Citromicrobium sp. RCC1885]|nr:hypothetical protein AAJ72_07665 [Citromicrobium sp. RCC1885]KPM28749.1 hypothetical protein AAJ74_08405 [Citromicrobium sp. RCC1878]